MINIQVYTRWLRKLSDRGGKGSVDKVDARALGHTAAALDILVYRLQLEQAKNRKLREEIQDMEWQQLQEDALNSEAAGVNITLVVPKEKPAGWPRGELLNDNGIQKVYSYDPLKILLWCRKNKPEELK